MVFLLFNYLYVAWYKLAYINVTLVSIALLVNYFITIRTLVVISSSGVLHSSPLGYSFVLRVQKDYVKTLHYKRNFHSVISFPNLLVSFEIGIS